MNIVKKRTVMIILLVLPFLVMGNCAQGMMYEFLSQIKEHSVKILTTGGVGFVGGIGGYLVGSSKKNLDKKMMKMLGLSKNSKVNPDTIRFAFHVYRKIKKKMDDLPEGKVPMAIYYHPNFLLSSYRTNFGGEGTINKLLKIIRAEVGPSCNLASKSKLLYDLAEDSMKKEELLKVFLGKDEIGTAEALKKELDFVRAAAKKSKFFKTKFDVDGCSIYQILANKK